MPEIKIQIKIGQIEFSAEGEKDWIEKQLDKIIDKAPSLVKLVPFLKPTPENNIQYSQLKSDPSIANKQLASFLKEKNATSNQVQKFLATAIWLDAKGSNLLTTRDITSTLSDNKQSGLKNASQCLSDNIGKGYCEKKGKQFFVTDEGKNSL
jgi:hypothetical protein